jgi:hypothetical protein
MKVFGFHMMIKAFVSQFNIEIKSSFFPSLLRLQRKMVGRGGAVRCGAVRRWRGCGQMQQGRA